MTTDTFNGKHVLLTGAGGGLGSALARDLTGMGAHLVLSGRLLEPLDEMKAVLSGDGAIITVRADLSVPAEAEQLALRAVEALGHIDVLINNAGVGYHALMEETVDARIRQAFEVNTFAPLALTGTIWPKLSDRRLAPVRDAALARRGGGKSPSERRWRLWQLETSIACNLDCIMCPWKRERRQKFKTGDMSADIWEALRPYLGETASVDFSGGGEPLLHPRLAEWVREAGDHGCRTGFLTNGVILNPALSSGFIQAGLDWIGFSVDGATADVYNEIRMGADFRQVCEHIAAVAAQRVGQRPRIIVNFVMMQANAHQLGEIVRLAARLGVDQVNFKQCDVIRGAHGGGGGLFASRETRAIRRHKRALEKARRLAQKSGIETTAFAFVPDELPVCAQDPRASLFIRHEGHVAPCINLANGGPASFLGEPAIMPTVHYGRLPKQDLMGLWDTAACRFYRTRFEQRVQAYNAVIAGSSFEASLIKLKETLTAAVEAMPAAPEGCRVCHYLYDI